ncbi:MAG: YggS family pyridoxal phosphate-dependent enzyme [Parachlamydiaceae bacterium]|nr:YggS family pyridoxal phosphate-dependent enzyme [Parachlamydiaceae bacterium]
MPSSNYLLIKQQITEIAEKYGRNPSDICLVAVTKGHTWDEIFPLYTAGQRIFGESRQQEAEPKIALAPIDTCWHFIGTLQQNKVRKIIGKFALIHSVDTPGLAQKISACSQEAGVVTELLLQVNISGELSKHGLGIDAWQRELEKVLCLPAISVMGMMTMAPFEGNEKTVRNCFSRLREFRDSLGIELPYLSMGMSRDFPWAIAEGATHLRIGSALF